MQGYPIAANNPCKDIQIAANNPCRDIQIAANNPCRDIQIAAMQCSGQSLQLLVECGAATVSLQIIKEDDIGADDFSVIGVAIM